MRNILFFGNSLTAGYGLASPSTQSYPALIQKMVNEEKLAFRCINAGVSGDTSHGGLMRLDRWLNDHIDVFILELGVNDFLRGMSASSTYDNLDKILTKVISNYPHCKLIVMGMEVPAFLSNLRIDAFRSVFKHVAEKHNAAFVPFFLEGVAGIKDLNLPDGLHPSARGYEVIARNVWPTVRGVLV